MNLNHTVKVVGSVLLSAVMAGSMMPVTVFAQSNDENPTEKTETVYSVLTLMVQSAIQLYLAGYMMRMELIILKKL